LLIVRSTWLPSIILALIGLGDSVYLTYVKVTDQLALCGNLGDCESVNNSVYSEIGGVPIALLGAGAYLAILAALYVQRKYAQWYETAVLVVFGLSLVGVIYSAYLTYIEIAVLRAICPYCVVSAIVLLALLGISIADLRRDLAFAT
jgi:uncharacterized membrane protein